MLDLDAVYSASNRKELVVQRQKALDSFLLSKPVAANDFVWDLLRLDHAVEGREDLSWTIVVFGAGLRFLQDCEAGPEMRAGLLKQFAGCLTLHDQYTRARKVLEEALLIAPAGTTALRSIRQEILKAYASVVEVIGDPEAATAALEEATSIDGDPEEHEHSLWTLAEHYAKRGRMDQAESTVQRLITFLSSESAPPDEALRDGWHRVVAFYHDRCLSKEAVAAQWRLVDLVKGRGFQELLGELTRVYEVAGGLTNSEPESIVIDVLRQATGVGGDAGRVSALFEIASCDVVAQRQELATRRLEEALSLAKILGDRATKQQISAWKVRGDDVARGLARVARGEEIYSTVPVLRFLDRNGEPLSSPEPPPENPHQAFARALRNAPAPTTRAEAEELIAGILPADQRAEFLAGIEAFETVSNEPLEALRVRMRRIDENASAGIDEEAWKVVRGAIGAGEGSWAEGFLIHHLNREVEGHAHPFAIQGLMQELLDALGRRQAWEEGRHWLRWWRDLIGNIDHPDSTRTLENYESEAAWETRAGSPQRTWEIYQDQMEFATRVMGAGHSTTVHLASRLRSSLS